MVCLEESVCVGGGEMGRDGDTYFTTEKAQVQQAENQYKKN